ncbi:extracellular solute-binding protein [Nocardioides sp. NPDC023903]|uniref:ABC transporter substrate-binding protein n=1 Tax=Nocardioides sp. NPDC023903 TaxID=3157195 RepID=UPI0033E8A584
MRERALRRVPAAVAAVTIAALALAGCGGGDAGDDGPVELTWFMGAGVPDDIATAEQLAADFNAENDDIEVVVDASGPEGVELDNAVKTQLSTGEMPDLFWYNSGALMQALNPDQQLLDVSDEPWVDDLQEDYTTTVSTDNGTYGAPVGQAMGGGFFYNIDVFEKAGVEVPQTWDEMLAAVKTIRGNGVDPVIQSHGDTWTSQMLVLADYYNVQAQDPEFADQLTANKVKFSEEPGLSSFRKLEDLAAVDAFNADFPTTLLDQALAKLAKGEGAMYPMLTFAQATIEQNHADQADSIGFFPVPGESADDYGLTTWMPSSVYSPAYTEHPDEVKRFMAFVASSDGCAAITEARGITGPYVVDGCEITGDVSRIVSDMLPFFEDDRVAPALEFLSPVKGPNLQNFTVELGSGSTDAKSAAAEYDKDNELQAQQLGLEGW